jgi:ubiquinone/menaquinone biosynthesis C-methylase UbiE
VAGLWGISALALASSEAMVYRVTEPFAAMTIEQALFRLHEGLPRNSPGSEKSTLKALRRLGRLPRHARVIDLGCGNGASAIALARRLQSEVVAVDAHEPFLRTLEERCRAEGLDSLVVARHADFSALEEPNSSFDLLWSEGAAYVLGFESAIVQWRPLLKKGGRAAVTELSWGQESPSEETKEYWSSVYPGMRTTVGNCAAAERAGYSVIDTITLSNKDWAAYYGPLKQRIAELRAEGEPSPELAVVVEEAEREIAIYERHGDEFGYVFYLLENQADDEILGEDEAEVESSDDSAEGTEDAEPLTPLRRAARLQAGFNGEIAPVDLAAHRATEARFAELVAEIGLERASRMLEAIRNRVTEAIR